ncbi:MAG TPA: 3-phosphoshikimate 1-carboxyvinyltransferase [Myxococcota bacterium]|nr:3-phosphoshikimate 1-carboxyvinyltransferase [Myxococcota bacterium]
MVARAYPAELAIRPRGPLAATLRVPGSKSITNRAAVCAALARGESQLLGALESDDTEAMRQALCALGAAIDVDGTTWRVCGVDGHVRAPATLDARASGTTARFLTAAAQLADGAVIVDGSARMRERPIEELVRTLRALGASIEILGTEGCPPVRVAGGGLRGGRAPIDARRSSQFVSAVLLAAPYAREDVVIEPVGGVVVSRPYVDLTLEVMRAFGAECGWAAGGRELVVAAGRHYRGCRYEVEPDASAAAYPFAAAAIAGGRVCVEGIAPESLQSDFRLVDVLAKMGCTVERGSQSLAVCGPVGGLHGIDADMNDLPDAVLALAVVALFAQGPTRIRNVANLRIKETDRLAALERELGKLGARAKTGPDWLLIEPGPLHGAAIDTYSDHRMAMAFALAGLRVPGVVIRDPGCVAKTWPDYFEALERL